MLQSTTDELMNLNFSCGAALGNNIIAIMNGFINLVMESKLNYGRTYNSVGRVCMNFLFGRDSI